MTSEFNNMLKLKFMRSLIIIFALSFFAQADAQNDKEKLERASKIPVTIKYDEQLNTPLFIKGEFPYAKGLSKAQVAIRFFNDHRGFMKIPASHSIEFKKSYANKKNKDNIVRLTQKIKNIPIWGSDIALNISDNNEVNTVIGKIYDIDINTIPKINRSSAVNSAVADLNSSLSRKATTELNAYIKNGAGLLVWHVVLHTDNADEIPGEWHYFIDAHNGKLVSKFNNIKDIKDRKTYTANNGTTLPGTLLISEGGSSTDAVAQNVHNNIGATYDYYLSAFNRDSYDDLGATIVQTVHYSTNYVNAYWNGTQLVYGDGDGVQSDPLGNALDVVAHEFTHAVTEKTANLIYQDQSGALNESMSDVFAALVDSTDWLIGEDVWTPATPGDALRYMNNPPLGNQPDHMNNYLVTTADNGGVHTNSGITNKAFYNVATAIGRPAAAQIYYRALITYFTASTDFQAARVGLIQAATDLYGASSAQVTAVETGFDAVGILGPPVDFVGTFVASAYSTPHPYANSTTYAKTFTHPGATGMKVSFTTFDTESGYDFVKIKDGTGAVIYTYSGAKGAFVSGPVNGETITVELITDASVTNNGFDIDGYLYNGSTSDVTPPVISAVTASGITDNAATITWTTDEPASSQVEYGLTTAYGSLSTLDAALVTSHSVTLTGLTAATTYNYRVKSADASSNLATSANYTFATTVSTANNYEPNDTFADAKTINYGEVIRSYIQTNGDEDYFKFTIPQGGAINVNLNNFPGDYDIFLYDSAYTELGRGYTTAMPEIIDYTAAAAGTFYVRVDGYTTSYSAVDDYELTITFTPTAAAQWYYVTQNIESAHPYLNNTNTTQTYSHPGAQQVAVHFTRFETELNYDFVYIRDKNNVSTASHHGTKAAFWATVTGDEIRVNFVSDYSITAWGYQIDQVAYYSTTPLTAGLVPGSGNKDKLKKVSGTLVHINNTKGNPVDPSALFKGTAKAENEGIPTKFSSEAYPNPFNPSTNIKFSIPTAGFYTLSVYNILGQQVSILADKEFLPGSYNVNFDASKLASGIYIYRLSGKNVNISQKILLMK